MTGSAPSLAKKQLAHDLRIIVGVQVVALGTAGLGGYLFSSKIVPNYPEWDTVHSLCGALVTSGVAVFIVAAFWGSWRLGELDSQPIWTRLYSYSCLPVFFLATTIVHFCNTPIPLNIFAGYIIVPQFFIARGWRKGQKKMALPRTRVDEQL